MMTVSLKETQKREKERMRKMEKLVQWRLASVEGKNERDCEDGDEKEGRGG